MLAEHLGLKAGEGIVVRALMPDGPAAKAGVAVHDIITRVADQPVASSQDLTKLVASPPTRRENPSRRSFTKANPPALM